MSRELNKAERATHCLLDRDETRLLRKVVWRRLIKAASGGATMSYEQAWNSCELMNLPADLMSSVRFPINDELAATLIEFLEEACTDLDGQEFKLAQDTTYCLRSLHPV